MAGESARPHKQSSDQTQGEEATAVAEWYAVSRGGGVALRIAPGLTVGEYDSGALAVNDADPRYQWISFDLVEGGFPSVAIVTRDKSLMVGGVNHMRRALRAGESLKLPHNSLYISRDERLPRADGPVLEVVPRQVPGRPQDLVAPGWDEALKAAKAAPPASADPLGPGLAPDAAAEELAPRPEPAAEPAPGQGPPSRHAPAGDDLDVTVAQSERRPHSDRRTRRRRSSATALYLAGGVLVLAIAGAAVVVLGPDQLLGRGEAEVAAPAPAPEPVVEQSARTAPEPLRRSQTPAQPGLADAPSAGAAPAMSPELPAAQRSQPPVEPAQAPRSTARVAEPATVPAPAPESRTGIPSGAAPAPPAADPAAGSPVAGSRVDGRPSADATPVDRDADPGATTPPEPAVADPGTATTADAAQPSEPAASGGASAANAADLDWRLIRARELMEAGYITFPPQDNAVAYIERLLADQPGNPRALALLAECTTRLLAAAVRAHDQGLDYEARNTLEEIMGFNPNHQQTRRLWNEWVENAR